MNLTGFSICIIAQLSDCIFQLHVLLSFSECLNAMPGVSVVGEDKNKEI